MGRNAIVVAAAALTIVLGGCRSPGPDDQRADDPRPAGVTDATASGPADIGSPTVLARGLSVPWGVAFLPGGDALVSERISHRIVRVDPGGTVTAVGVVPGVADDAGEGGLLGLALSPTFRRDHLVYAYLTAADDNRIVRFTYDGTAISAPEAVFTGIPKGGIHDGGRIAFGPDGLLYATAGETGQPDRAQDVAFLGGKVLRMTADGRPAPGNPFPGSVVFTLGHRNPQGLAWGPDGRLYEAEFGQNALDEINLIEAGHNYGWPAAEGTIGSTDARFTRPLLTYRTDEASPSGLAYAAGSLWLGALRGERLYRIPLTGATLGRPVSLLTGRYGRLRTTALAPDGSMWVTTSNRDGRGRPADGDDRIIRVPLAGA